MNDFIQLTPQSNVYEAETMVEGKVSLSSYVVEILTFTKFSYLYTRVLFL